MAADKDYEIKVCTFPFWCKCGKLVRVGENYILRGGIKLCMDEIPVNEEAQSKERPTQSLDSLSNERALMHLRKENLKMRLELEIISRNPDCKAARKIIAKYTRKRNIRNELQISNQN